MEFTQEHSLLQNTLRKFGQKELLDKAADFDKKGEFPTMIVNKLAELGVMGACIPEPYNGTALDMISLVISLEELSQVCGSTALTVGSHNGFVAYPLAKFGSEEMKKRYLPGLAFGELIGGFAEPGAINVAYRSEADGLRLSGESKFLIGGLAQGVYLLFVRPEAGEKTLTALLVEGKSKGVKIRGRAATIGMKAAGIADVAFEDCVVPRAGILGKEGEGAKILEAIIDRARIAVAAIAVGLAQISIDAAIKYAKTRVQFGQPIINFGMVQSRIAEMTTRVSAARHLVYDAAQKCDQEKDFSREAAMAKYFASQAGINNATDAIQIHGGYGYTTDYPVERYFRDAQVCGILLSSPIQEKDLIARKTIG